MVYHNTGTKENPIPCFPFPGLNSYGRQDRRIDTGTESPHHTAGALRKRSRGFAWRLSPADTAIKHGHIISKQVDWPKKYVVILIIHYLPTEGYFNATLPGKNLENSEWFSPTGHLSRPSMFGQMDRWREKSRTTRGPVYQPFSDWTHFVNTTWIPKPLSVSTFLASHFRWHLFLLEPLSLHIHFSWHPFLGATVVWTPLSPWHIFLLTSFSDVSTFSWSGFPLTILTSLALIALNLDISFSWPLYWGPFLLMFFLLKGLNVYHLTLLAFFSPDISFYWHVLAALVDDRRVDPLTLSMISSKHRPLLKLTSASQSSLLYFHHFAIFFMSLHSSLLYIIIFLRLYFLSKRHGQFFLQLSAVSLQFTSIFLPYIIDMGGREKPCQPFPAKALFEQLGGDRQGLWPHGRTGRAPRPDSTTKNIDPYI